MIEINALRKSFNVPSGERFLWFPKWRKEEVLKGLSFRISEGEFVGLVGPNGAGKTTLVKILSGILTPDSGKALIAGFVPWQRKKHFFKYIGVLFGNRSNLIFDVPIIDSFLLLKDIYGIEEKIFRKRIEEFSELLELRPLLEVPARKLSFGQRMRAEIASIFLHSPKVVFLDEPTIALDALGKERVYEFLRTINKRDRVTIVLTTHNLAEIELLCRRMILLHKGEVVWDGDIEEFRKAHLKYKDVRFELLGKIGKEDLIKKYGFEKSGSLVSGRIAVERQVEFVGELMRNYRLTSLTIEEPELEEIVLDVYREMKK